MELKGKSQPVPVYRVQLVTDDVLRPATSASRPAGASPSRCEAHADDARALLAEGSLYEAASRDRAARPLEGRGIAYAIALPVSGTRVVVRHNRHGGLFAPVTRDLFLPPTRAPHELRTAMRLDGARRADAAGADVRRRAGWYRLPSRGRGDARGARTRAICRRTCARGRPNVERDAAWEATRALRARR